MVFQLLYSIFYISSWCATATGRLEDDARQAHDEIEGLRKKENERWTKVQKKLLESSRPYERSLEDYYQSNNNQYNVYQQNSMYGMWNASMSEVDFGFDITSYSFKYTGCHDVGYKWKSGENPSRYATFRLCPTNSCSGKSTWGCKSDYGEYIVPVDLLVSSLIEHNEARVRGYCEYCQRCAAVESYKLFAGEVLMHKEYVLSYAQQRFSTWCARGTSGSNYRDDQKSWQTMRSTFGTWYDRTIYPGFYDSDGQFNACWGYSSANNGFICLDTELADGPGVYWDTDIFGTAPETWTYFLYNGYIVDQQELCDSRYSSSCYNQYDACMEILNYQQPQGNNYNNVESGNGGRLKLIELLQCVPISENDIQYSALAFYTKYVYAQERFQQYNTQTENYASNNGQNGNYYKKYYGDNGAEASANLYIGPACGGDSMAIKLAVYSDEYCTQRVHETSVSELLGYNPLAENTDIFPSECISCRPPDEELRWYETEEIEDPVMPFCSILYQFAGKCNVRLKPNGRYDPDILYNQEDDGTFMAGTCTMVEALNLQIENDQSWMKKLGDEIRMRRKELSPGAKAGIVITTLIFAGLAVAGFIHRNMHAIELGTRKLKPNDIPEIPNFDYRDADLERKDSGVGQARGESPRRSARNMSRFRSAPKVLSQSQTRSGFDD
eukprot:scaffold212_cov173-Amphora_coffeaeformis.AAC.15